MRDARDSVEANRVVAGLSFAGSTFPFVASADGTDCAVSAAPDSVAPDSAALFSAVRGVSAKCIRRQLAVVDISVRKRSSIHRGCRKPIPGRTQRTGAQVSLQCQPKKQNNIQ